MLKLAVNPEPGDKPSAISRQLSAAPNLTVGDLIQRFYLITANKWRGRPECISKIFTLAAGRGWRQLQSQG